MIVVFDVTSRKSYDNVTKWMNSIAEHADPSIIKVLVGNKIDLEEERDVTSSEAATLARDFGVRYFETSAKQNKNVTEVIEHIIGEVHAYR